jgi:hypothetical protein
MIPMTSEMANAAGVPEGSSVVLYFRDGAVAAEILPPASEELREKVSLVAKEFGEAFAEMKRHGD